MESVKLCRLRRFVGYMNGESAWVHGFVGKWMSWVGRVCFMGLLNFGLGQ